MILFPIWKDSKILKLPIIQSTENLKKIYNIKIIIQEILTRIY